MGVQVRWFGRRLVGVVLLLELDRAEVAEPFLDAAGVIETVDVLEDAGRPATDWCRLPLFFAWMWEPSTHARDQSSSPAAFSSASRMRCSCSKTPACCHRPKRRQQVCPEPNPSSRGRSCQAMSLCRTYRMPCRHSRSAIGRGPGARSSQGGSNGSISAHESSSTIHGRELTHHEQPNHHTGHARPGHLNKILLRALLLQSQFPVSAGQGLFFEPSGLTVRQGRVRGHGGRCRRTRERAWLRTDERAGFLMC